MAIYIRRRAFISALLGGVAGAWPLAAQAQQPVKVHRIAFANAAVPVTELTETGSIRPYRAFFKELRRLGYVEGQNLIVKRYSGQGQTEHYADLARDVVRSKPDVILTTVPAQYFKPLTATIPIVGVLPDPIGFGYAASLAHPGGNVTGVVGDASPEIQAKLLELLKETFPQVSRIGVLGRQPPGSPYSEARKEGAQRLGLMLVGPPLEGTLRETEYRHVFEAMAQEHADALLVGGDSENFANRQLIVGLAEKYRLPTIYPLREYVESGGLMAYATDLVDLYTRLAGYIDRILKGEPPSDIPIYQAVKFELVINVKAANAIGLTIPPALLARADEVSNEASRLHRGARCSDVPIGCSRAASRADLSPWSRIAGAV